MALVLDKRALVELVSRVARGAVGVDEAVSRLEVLPFEDAGDAKLDHHRELRTGQAEAVYGPGKSPQQIRAAVTSLVDHTSGAVFVTRATPAQFAAAREVAPSAEYDDRARLVVAKRAPRDPLLGSVAVVSAGTADLPVAEEAALTAEALGVDVVRVSDVGVAGVHRVLDHREQLRRASCVIVIAGMEGALPSVIAGLVSAPIIAVPTSTGYGAAFEGIAALLAMLSSCAPGVAVVNIDNGFGAAHVAHRILKGGGKPRPTHGDESAEAAR